MHFNTYVLGDLCKSDAHRYFLQLIEAQSIEIQDLFPVDENSFDEIFHLTGGRMLLIEDYVYQVIYSMATTRILPDGDENLKLKTARTYLTLIATVKTFNPVLKAKSGLEQKLYSAAGKSHTQQNMLTVFSAIVKSGCGYVPYKNLTELVGTVQVESMIDQKIIYYRPESDFYSDLVPMPESGVVTAESTSALRAMEALLVRFSVEKDTPVQNLID